MNTEDQVFWDRIAEMPAIEAEQECVMRREEASLQLAMLTSERAKAEAENRHREAKQLGVAIFEMGSQFTLLNERIKYLRRVMDSINWRECVKAVCGQDGYEACVVWRQQREMEWRATNPLKEIA